MSESYHYVDGNGFDEKREMFWSYTWTISCPDNVYAQLATPELVRDFTEKVNRLGLPAMEPAQQIIAAAHNDLGDDWRNKVFAQLADLASIIRAMYGMKTSLRFCMTSCVLGLRKR